MDRETILFLIIKHEGLFDREIALSDRKTSDNDWSYHWKRASYHSGILAELRVRLRIASILESGRANAEAA
jgi:hypothetical protein